MTPQTAHGTTRTASVPSQLRTTTSRRAKPGGGATGPAGTQRSGTIPVSPVHQSDDAREQSAALQSEIDIAAGW